MQKTPEESEVGKKKRGVRRKKEEKADQESKIAEEIKHNIVQQTKSQRDKLLM